MASITSSFSWARVLVFAVLVLASVAGLAFVEGTLPVGALSTLGTVAFWLFTREIDARPRKGSVSSLRLEGERSLFRLRLATSELDGAPPGAPAPLPEALRLRLKRNGIHCEAESWIEPNPMGWALTRERGAEPSYEIVRDPDDVDHHVVLAKRVFSGIGSPRGDRFDRANQVLPIEEHLASVAGVSVLTGASGTGKTTVVDELLPAGLRTRGWGEEPVRTVKGWARSGTAAYRKELEGGVAAHAPVLRKGGRAVLVLDQFEEVVRAGAEPRLVDWFPQVLADLCAKWPTLRILLVIRDDYFTRLLPLLARIPGFDVGGRTLVLRGIPPDAPDLTQFSERLVRAVGGTGEQIAEAVLADLPAGGTILPLSLEAIGYVLERAASQESRSGGVLTKDAYAKRFQDVQGVMREYYRLHYAGTSDPATAIRVLFALSSEGKERPELDVDTLAKITHCDKSAVARVAQRMFESRLLLCDEGRYRFAHDYLAEDFHAQSGSLLDALERDHIEQFRHLAADSPTKLQRALVDRVPVRRAWEWAFGLVRLVICIRLFVHFPKPPWGSEWESVVPVAPVDMDYAPSFIASWASLTYVRAIFVHFLLLVPDLGLRAPFGAAACMAMILLGTFDPQGWALWASAGGVFVALVASGLGVRLRNEPRPAAKGLQRLVRLTMMNMAATFLGGLYFYEFGPHMFANLWYRWIAEMILALAFWVFLRISLNTHAKRDQGQVLLASVDRLRLETAVTGT